MCRGLQKRERDRRKGVSAVGVRSQEVSALSADTKVTDKVSQSEPQCGSRECRCRPHHSTFCVVLTFIYWMVLFCVLQPVDEADGTDLKVVQDSQVWVPAEEPVINPAFLFDSKIWEICQELPIHWIHPTPLSGRSRGHCCPLTLSLEGIPAGYIWPHRDSQPGLLLCLWSSGDLLFAADSGRTSDPWSILCFCIITAATPLCDTAMKKLGINFSTFILNVSD